MCRLVTNMRGTITLWLWGVLTLVLGGLWCCFGCLEKEKIALLQLKSHLNYPNGTSLPSWEDHEEKYSNCCEWEGVECHSTTGRVTVLSLNHTRDHELGDWYFNASLFLPFEELKHLYLSGNNLTGWIENEGFERLWRLRSIEELDLSDNMFNISALSSLSGLSSLKFLDLGGNDMKGETVNSFGRLEGLSNLKVLYLSNNQLNISIRSFLKLEDFISLEVLDLSDNYIKDFERIQGVCELKNLQQLDISFNEFEGTIPSCLENLTFLKHLDLSFNQFTGNIASSPLRNITSLEFLGFSHNHFQIPLSFESFYNHSKLRVIIAHHNKCILDDQFSNRAPMFQLKIFVMVSCMLNNLPDFLYHQHDLRHLDLSHNNVSGIFPSWLLRNNTGLEDLYFKNNTLTGPFNLPSNPNPNFSTLDISMNHIQGQVPGNMSSVFPNLEVLILSKNLFSGNTVSCFDGLKHLDSLDLSNNSLSGNILEQLVSGCPLLRFLRLSNNYFYGQIPPKISSLTALRFLFVNGNNFTGEIPSSLFAMNLSALDFSYNHFSGNLPQWKGEITRTIKVIVLPQNNFQGFIPIEFCNLVELEFLDLSGNNLHGFIPSCFNPPNLKHVHLSNNRLQGPLSLAFHNSSSLVTLDLRENNFSGKIPSWMGNLPMLSVLLLKANHFEGKIPIQLCKLSQLSIMDLSHNSLSGPIPPCWSSLSFEATIGKSYVGIDSVSWESIVNTIKRYFGARKCSQLLKKKIFSDGSSGYEIVNVKEEVEFTTKKRTYSYTGNILDFMSGIDLSCNQLAGNIPHGIGNLSSIHVLNLSHNGLIGSIPSTFSNLGQLESLDLSYNNLNGRIPPQLTELYSLAVFSVAHNNLSGTTPEMKSQFATFEESSYEGNPLLCGPPLPNDCVEIEANSSTPAGSSEGKKEDESFLDMDRFYVSFVVSYVIVFLSIILILYINPYWREAWFELVEVCITTSYCYVKFHLSKLLSFRLNL